MPTQITPFTHTPSRANPATFSADMDSRLAEENSRIVQMNTQSTENNTLANTVVAKEALVSPHYAAIDNVSAWVDSGFPSVTSSDCIVVNTVADLANIPSGFTTSIVKDLDRGGTFIWSSTGTANGGTVFAGATGYWNRQYSGAVNVKWFGAVSGSDITSIYAYARVVSSLINIDDDFLTTGLVITSDTTLIGNGSLSNTLSNSRIFTVQSGSTLIVNNISIKGARPAFDVSATNIGIQVDNGTIELENVKVYDFAGCAINFASGGTDKNISVISNCEIYNNATGINTNDYEYIRIDNNSIHSNGLNVAKTNWSALYGTETGFGIYGRFANCSLTNNTINGNTIGVYLNSIGGSNPDHNKISNNTINHNYAAGLILQGLNSYETVIGNTILSNVTRAEAPTVIYTPRSTSVDMSIVDCIGINFIGNDVGAGSDIMIPIFGHARCRYIGNNWIYYPPTELRHPLTGAAVFDFYGYLKNGDNLFLGNMTRNESTANLGAVILADSVRTVVKNEVLSAGYGAGSGGGTMLDDVVFKVAYTNGWAQFGGSLESYYVKNSTKQVNLWIMAIAPASVGTSITTLPVGFRPINGSFAMAGVGNSLTSSYGTVYPDGTITVVGATAGQPVLLHFSFITSY